MRPFPLLIAAALLATACAKYKGAPAPAPAAPAAERRNAIANASLSVNAKKLLDGKFRSACDDRVEAGRQAVIAALDARAAEISAYQSAHPSSSLYRVVPFGPTYARERFSLPAVKEGWQRDSLSWDDIAKEFADAKAKPIGPEWVQLNSDVRGTLTDDVDRIANGANMQIDENSEGPLRRLYAELSACDADSSCTDPHFSPESLAFIPTMKRLKEQYDWWNAEFQAKSGAPAIRTALHRFLDWEKYDVAYFDYNRNAKVRATSPGHYVLPVDPGPFADAAEQLRHYVESLWHDDTHSVTLELAPAPDVYRVVLEDDPGGRSFVLWGKKEVHLDPYVRARSIAHEFGHVLGFPDHYYDVFDYDTCGYSSHYLENDLMSDSGIGSVLPAHWSELERQYPATP
jgi:hypothetical protein